MAERTYQQTLVGVGDAGEASEEDVMVRDDELLDDEHESGSTADAPRWSATAPRASRRSRSGVRSGWARPGDVLVGKYAVEQVGGRSGSEMVVFARHLELGQRVTLRYLLPEASASSEAVARFQRGARKARDLKSLHAERVIDFGRFESGSPYRVSELPSGPSLAEILRVRGALPIADAIDIVVSACEPVAEAHASGLVHRSLSTTNVFVERRADGSQFVTVLDFGVSDPLEVDPSQVAGSNALTMPAASELFAFASPEQIRNSGAVDARTDVWAFGAILYQLLTGVRVFEAETPLTLLAMIAADRPAPVHWLRPDVPEALETIVLSCLEKEPDARPRSVLELASALAPFGSAEAATMAGRVSRIGMRSTKPPPLPSSALPHAEPAYATRAIVRSSPPLVAAPVSSASLPGWAMMTGGILIGVCFGLATVLFMRLQPAPAPVPAAAAPAAALPAPVVVLPSPTLGTAAPGAAGPVATLPAAPVPAQAIPGGAVPPATIPTAQVPGAAAPIPTAAPIPALAPPPQGVRQRPAKRAEARPERESTASEQNPASRTARASAASERGTAEASAKPKDLFGGMD